MSSALFRSYGGCQVGRVSQISLDQVTLVHSGQAGQFRSVQVVRSGHARQVSLVQFRSVRPERSGQVKSLRTGQVNWARAGQIWSVRAGPDMSAAVRSRQVSLQSR